jgi:hypothetical protein
MRLVQYRQGVVTQDVAEALRQLEHQASKLSAKLQVEFPSQDTSWERVRKNPGPTGLPPEWSAVPTGREVYLRLQLDKDDGSENTAKERGLALLWAIAYPLGFTPYARYPLPGAYEQVFHFLGPWHGLFDNFIGSGNGEAAWPAFCCAAQIDVDVWEGGRKNERLVQAHLHRIGVNVGTLDGVLGPRTQGGLKAVSLHSLPLTDVVSKIVSKASFRPPELEDPHQALLRMPEISWSVHHYGQVRATRNTQGAVLDISGPGRVVLDIK